MDNLVKMIRYLKLSNLRAFVTDSNPNVIKVTMFDRNNKECARMFIEQVENGFIIERHYNMGGLGLYEGLETERDVINKIKEIHHIVEENRIYDVVLKEN